jgi:hypothetical protein
MHTVEWNAVTVGTLIHPFVVNTVVNHKLNRLITRRIEPCAERFLVLLVNVPRGWDVVSISLPRWPVSMTVTDALDGGLGCAQK